MTNLPNDVTRCHGTTCPERDDCARYRQLARDAARAPPLHRRSLADTMRDTITSPMPPCRWRIAEA